MNKKIIFHTILFLMILSFVSCGNKETTEENTESEQQREEKQAEILSVADSQSIVSNTFKDHKKISYTPDKDKKDDGAEVYCFAVDNKEGTALYAYVWVNSVTEAIEIEEAKIEEEKYKEETQEESEQEEVTQKILSPKEAESILNDLYVEGWLEYNPSKDKTVDGVKIYCFNLYNSGKGEIFAYDWVNSVTGYVETEYVQTPTQEYSNSQQAQSAAKENYLVTLNYLYDMENDLYSVTGQDEMNKATAELWKAWDYELNRIYGLLKEKLSVADMEALKIEQREWIKMRDAETESLSKIFGNESLTALENSAGADTTEERTLELIDIYFSY